eukprot:scaffold173176_cov31-Tisochrysis_lutea.AAC.2
MVASWRAGALMAIGASISRGTTLTYVKESAPLALAAHDVVDRPAAHQHVSSKCPLAHPNPSARHRHQQERNPHPQWALRQPLQLPAPWRRCSQRPAGLTRAVRPEVPRPRAPWRPKGLQTPTAGPKRRHRASRPRSPQPHPMAAPMSRLRLPPLRAPGGQARGVPLGSRPTAPREGACTPLA